METCRIEKSSSHAARAALGEDPYGGPSAAGAGPPPRVALLGHRSGQAAISRDTSRRRDSWNTTLDGRKCTASRTCGHTEK
jgi:hypothetical protein